MISESLQVPLNRAKFRKYRNLNVTTASMGLGMVLLSFAGFVFSLYTIFASSTLDGWWVLSGVLCAWLVVLISLATAPAWLLASTQTKVLRQHLPALLVDLDGIVDNSSNYGLGRIRWDEIESFSESSRESSRYSLTQTFTGIAFIVKDKKMLLRKKPKLLAMWMEMDEEIKSKHWLFIPQGRIEMPVEEVVRLANQIKERNP